MLDQFYDKERIIAGLRSAAEQAAVDAPTSRDRFIVLAKVEMVISVIELHHRLMKSEMVNGADNEVAAAIDAYQSIIPVIASCLSIFIPLAMPFAMEDIVQIGKESVNAIGKMVSESLGGLHKSHTQITKEVEKIVDGLKNPSLSDIASIVKEVKRRHAEAAE